ncbi:mitochondrial ribosomal protein S33 (predicted), isoform CRA_b [Rattus norvegicus]|uniref:Mitochondrial ribosomal protein S33 (Predicted), isoform CRA_b n=1 Tax=Rattus norvegicus TaxID=10116 RepID=A6IEW2_RAT|nr:mitochondrial ribosomal protein S33 (predicted), isoform CRA_b [Rattus norvegicus]
MNVLCFLYSSVASPPNPNLSSLRPVSLCFHHPACSLRGA